MKKLVIAAVLMLCLIPVAGLAQTPLSPLFENFESIAPVDGSMAAAGWLCYNNYFDNTGTWYWGGAFSPIVNNVANICDIVSGQGGPEQDNQQLVVYNNYWDGAHLNPGHVIETNVYQEWAITPSAGTWHFTFDAKMGDLVNPPSEAFAFIKVLVPGPWTSTVYAVDMTNTPTTWTDYEITVDLNGLEGQIVQIGFLHNASEYSPCGVYYDNIAFTTDGAVANEDKSWSAVKSLYR